MSAISLPPVKDYNVNQNFITLTREINFLKEAVNSKQVSVGYGFTGKEGDSRISVDTDGNVHFDINSRNGWFTTFDGCFYPKTKDGHANLYIKNLEVDNLFAKTFTIKQTNAFNGDWIVSDAGIVESVLGNIVTFKDQTNLNACPFVVGDIIFTRRIKADKSLDIKYIKGTVVTVSGKSITVTYTSTDRFATGDTIVRVGNSVDSTRRDSILFSVNETKTPYIDVYNGISTWSGTGINNWDYRTPLVRMGNLSGIDISYGHGIYISSGGQLIIQSESSVVGLPLVHTYNQTSTPASPTAQDIWNYAVTDGIGAASISAAGSGYSVGNILTLAGGTSGKVYVTGVDGSGGVTAIQIYSAGYGYTTGVKATSGGGGTSCTIDVTNASYGYNILRRYTGSVWEDVGSKGTFIDSNGVYTGLVLAQQVIAGTLTGFTIQTATSGQRVVIDSSNTITFYDSGGSSAGSITGGSGVGSSVISVSGSMYGTFITALTVSPGGTYDHTNWAKLDGGQITLGNTRLQDVPPTVTTKTTIGADGGISCDSVGVGASAGVSGSLSCLTFSVNGNLAINTSGVVTSGTWQGTAITDSYISSASTWNAKLSSVTADSPLSGSGTSGSHLVIAQATTSTSGYLSSTDWNTFNGKANAFTGVNSTINVMDSTGTTYYTLTFTNGVCTTIVAH